MTAVAIEKKNKEDRRKALTAAVAFDDTEIQPNSLQEPTRF